ncbi:IS66 family transposase [Ochrobactrum sp. MYb379]|uniref:IS66 family transposase n=1 Tax=Ochrobactrum sp. MYb379 TaxID=2745275 RepID=UPI00403F8A30
MKIAECRWRLCHAPREPALSLVGYDRDQKWPQTQRCKVSAISRLGEKLTYIHNQWEGLQTFLTDGRVEIDPTRLKPHPAYRS